jgi:cyclic pyranopterin phosphate synthase
MSNGDDSPPHLPHLDPQGRAYMVDISQKPSTERVAITRCRLLMAPSTLSALRLGQLSKGDALASARIAGIMAAKQTPLLIPLCHGLNLSHATIRFAYIDQPSSVLVEATCKTTSPTGVEMEALVAAQIAAATLYDMLKGIDRHIVISDLHLSHKSGGRSGSLHNPLPIPGLLDETPWL